MASALNDIEVTLPTKQQIGEKRWLAQLLPPTLTVGSLSITCKRLELRPSEVYSI